MRTTKVGPILKTKTVSKSVRQNEQQDHERMMVDPILLIVYIYD